MKWTPELTQYLIDNYATKTRQQIADDLGIGKYSVNNKAHKLKLSKGANNGCFKKGRAPWNKGLKKLKMSEPTQFKKGNQPYNTKHDGCESIRRDKSGAKYVYIRLSKRVWVPKHRHIWTQAHGQIPQGHAVVFRNGDTLDIRLDNLELVTRAELLRRNQVGVDKVQVGKALLESNTYIASRMSMKDKELKRLLLHHPELLEVKRLQIKLNRSINGR